MARTSQETDPAQISRGVWATTPPQVWVRIKEGLALDFGEGWVVAQELSLIQAFEIGSLN